ncbi:K+ channel signal transduction histidine kinase [Nitrosotalea devaniterrae]|uniref:histidine kinase n=2 Tax=cellular organisms TaxID=131567 RepID=A0A128A4E7_9ARCH|nr:K+ channel signal transduction histidine kinase [Candidatus Nitrosotalea devanaterra]
MFKQTTHAKLIVIASLLPIASFGIVGTISYYEINSFLDDENWVKHTYQVVGQADDVEKSILDIETGERGYLLTQNIAFLDPYNSGLNHIQAQLDSLRTSTVDNPVQQANIEKLALLVNQKIAFVNQTQTLGTSGNLDAASTLVKSLEGKKTMDSIRQVINDIKNEENTLLDKRSEASKTSSQNTLNTIIVGTAIAIIITIISTIAVYKKMKQRDEVDKTNIELHLETEKLKERDNAKAELSAMVSHELKTPLVTISGYAEMLRDESVLGKLNQEQIHAVETISSQTIKLERLISDIMDAQKMDLKKMKFSKREFAVDDLMDEQIQIHSKLMNDKNIQFTNTTREKLTIKSDPDRLNQVFANLIKNAVDFVPDNGKIEINAARKNGDVVFYVKDNGKGIPKEKQDGLFKKFYQIDTSLKRSHGGTGLGLVICKGITEALGGKIWLESEVGKGTTFYFQIPNNETIDQNHKEV